jgi:hypothetical protein
MLKRLWQRKVSASATWSPAVGKATLRHPISPLTLCVHKRCVWHVDNHVDERPIPRRTTAPYTLPIL